MNKQERLTEWINSLSLEEVQNLAYTTLSELIFTDCVRYHPEHEEGYNTPYWEASGEPLIYKK